MQTKCPSCDSKDIECRKEQKISKEKNKKEYECMNCECVWTATTVIDITKHGELWYKRKTKQFLDES